MYVPKRMFRIFKSLKPVPLGRWKTDKSIDATLRLIDLANCDSCGTCTVPVKRPTMKVDIKEKFLSIEGDVIDIGCMPVPGSFELHTKMNYNN